MSEQLTEVLSTLRQVAASISTEDRFLRIDDVCAMTGLPRAQI